MGEVTGIAWTDHTFNPWWGCTRVSPGCVNCYAETFAARFAVEWGPQAERRLFPEKHWQAPRKWDRAAAAAGVRRRVFCASMADVFEDRPELAAERAKLFELIRETPHLDWLLLTKRPENADRLWRAALIDSFNGADSLGQVWRENVWLGVTAEDQQRADERLPILCGIPAAVRFVSYEPALEAVDFRRLLWGSTDEIPGHALNDGAPAGPWKRRLLDWIIVGGESGHGARPFDLEWARSTVAQCKAAGVAVFVKQLGANPIAQGFGQPIEQSAESIARYGEYDPDPIVYDFLRPKGGDWTEWPEDLRVREFPR